jgi:hypothetical protein
VPGERVPRLSIALGLTGIVMATQTVLIGPLPLVARTPSERRRIIAIAIARPRSRLTPVAPIAVVSAIAPSPAWRVGVPLVIAGVIVPRIEVEHRVLRMNRLP